MRSSARTASSRRRVLAFVVLFAIGAGIVASLNQSLVACARTGQRAEPRPLSATEAQRLATMRLTNYRDGRSGLHATIGQPGQEIELTGWVDWQRPIAYLAATGPAQAKVDGLVQAMPGIIATRSGQLGAPARAATPAGNAGTQSPAAGAASATSEPLAATAGPLADPPATPPSDGWRVRLLNAAGGAAKSPLDTFVTLLFIVAANHPDAADLLAASQSRWLSHDKIDGVPVDVLLGPFVPPSARPSPPPSAPPIGPIAPSSAAAASATAKTNAIPKADSTVKTNGAAAKGDVPVKANVTAGQSAGAATAGSSASASRPPDNSLAAMGGAVRYYLDGQSRVRRLDTLLGANLPVRIDFQRDERPDLTAIDQLGGAAVTPRAVTAAEAKKLSRLRLHDQAIHGGTATITLPTPGARVVRATGWLDWANTIAYLALSDPDDPGPGALLVADRSGVATRLTSPTSGKAADTSRAGATLAKPPVPAPSGKGWTFTPWAQRADEYGSYDMDLLLSEALSLSSGQADDTGYLLKTAVWLRTDVVDGVPVTVYEIPKPAEKGVAHGQARLRYWVDKSDVLRRLEVRTRTTAFGQLDLTPGPIPKLGQGTTR